MNKLLYIIPIFLMAWSCNPAPLDTCDEFNQGELRTVSQGHHQSTPYLIGSARTGYSLKVSGWFKMKDPYNLHNVDQLDKCKIVGYKGSIFEGSVPYTSVMVSAHYDTLNNIYVIQPYFNTPDPLNRIVIDPQIIYAKIDEKVCYEVSWINNDAWVKIWKGSTYIESYQYLEMPLWKNLVMPWFGGNQVAPNNWRVEIFYDE